MNKPSQIYLLQGKDGQGFALEDILGPGVEAEKKRKEKEASKRKEEGQQEPDTKEESPFNEAIISEGDICLFPIPTPCGGKVVYAYKEKFNENHLFSTGLKIYDRANNTTEVLVGCEDKSEEELAMFVYNGLFGNRWRFFDGGNKLLLPSHERAATILNTIDLQTKKRAKVRLAFDFEADNVSILGFGT